MATNLVANKELQDKIIDLHRGLHLAMGELINKRNYERAEEILREVDVQFADAIHELKVLWA